MPDLVIDMIGVGEETGSLKTVLQRLAQTYRHEIEITFANLTTLMERLLLLVMGTIVALVVMSLFLPYYTLGNVITHY